MPLLMLYFAYDGNDDMSCHYYHYSVMVTSVIYCKSECWGYDWRKVRGVVGAELVLAVMMPTL